MPPTSVPCRVGAADHGLLVGADAASLVSLFVEPLGYLCVAHTKEECRQKFYCCRETEVRLRGGGCYSGQVVTRWSFRVSIPALVL